MWVLSGTLVWSERGYEILDGLFGQVKLVGASVGEEGLFGTRVGESEGRGGSGLVRGRALPLEICFLIIFKPKPEVSLDFV